MSDHDHRMDDADAEDSEEKKQIAEQNPPPPPLPVGWVRRDCRSNPGYFYWFHQDTGECRWEMEKEEQSRDDDDKRTPMGNSGVDASSDGIATNSIKPALLTNRSGKKSRASVDSSSNGGDHESSIHNSTTTAAAAGESSEKKGDIDSSTSQKKKSLTSPAASSSRKRTRTTEGSDDHRSGNNSSSKHPKEVRVLHLLKKHRDSRRPASWRNPKITLSKDKAIEDLTQLIDILQEVEGDPKGLRATFEDLAKTESDCSSAKRGGDLGFFGRKKMQPAFEKASFSLKVGELSDIVETSSGVHVILRLG